MAAIDDRITTISQGVDAVILAHLQVSKRLDILKNNIISIELSREVQVDANGMPRTDDNGQHMYTETRPRDRAYPNDELNDARRAQICDYCATELAALRTLLGVVA